MRPLRGLNAKTPNEAGAIGGRADAERTSRRGRRNEDEDEVQMEDGKSLMPRTIIRLRERRIAKETGSRVSGSRKKKKGEKTGPKPRYPQIVHYKTKVKQRKANGLTHARGETVARIL